LGNVILTNQVDTRSYLKMTGGKPTKKNIIPARKQTPQERLAVENVQNIARTIWTEARGEGVTAMIAVGWTLKNRMTRDEVSHVNQAWGGYQHGVPAPTTALAVARGILNGTTPDPTNGATHFYTPRIMPKKGDPTTGIDVGGGLETVPGVVDKTGKVVQNYRPGWTLTFDQEKVMGVPEAAFKFYRQPGSGHVQ
jgi:hypothetical protein